MRVLIVGCGYVGLNVGAELARQGHQVFGVRRTADTASVLKAAAIELARADITKLDELRALPGPFDWVVNTASSSKGGAEEYREVYLRGTRNLLEWLAATPPRKYVYTSSTSVYAQTDGSLVKETSPAEPDTEVGKVLLETEQALLEAARTAKFPAVILRVAGIYGPERGHLFTQYLRGEARIPGLGDRWINMIHRDDVAGAIVAALQSGRPGEIYNVADDEPVHYVNFFRWLSETLGLRMPPMIPEPAVHVSKRAITNKRICNRKLTMELGVRLKYSSFRQGYTAEIKRLEEIGVL